MNQNASNKNQDTRSEWIEPTVRTLDVSETAASSNVGNDGQPDLVNHSDCQAS